MLLKSITGIELSPPTSDTSIILHRILASGQADLVSMARPFLADPDLVNKVKQLNSDYCQEAQRIPATPTYIKKGR